MDLIEKLLNELTLEDSIASVMHYYLLLFLVVGGFLLIVLLYRTFRVIKRISSQASKGSLITLMIFILIQIYLTGSLLASYILLLMSKWETSRFLFPYDLLFSVHDKLSETAWFPLIAFAVIALGILVSLIFLLGALARLLGSEKDRFRGQENLTLAFLVSLIPIVLYWQQ